MKSVEELVYQYCREDPNLGQIIVRDGKKGVLFTGPDSPRDGEFIALNDLGYNNTLGFFRRSSFPKEASV